MKYVSLWEIDMSKLPADQTERVAVMTKMIEGVKQLLKDNPGIEWGGFIGENAGYSMGAKSALEVMRTNMMFAPYVKFKVYQAASIEEVEQVFKSVSQMQQK